jgi:hypothetical protein
MNMKTETETTIAPGQHRATFATDKRKGGYIVRVEGPYANRFAGREVPVTLKNGSTTKELLLKLLWSGMDKEKGTLCALYTFQARTAADTEVVIPF